MSTSIYYVYAYLREDGTPYYIGKGKGDRANKGKHFVAIPPVDRIQFIQENMSEEDALAMEIELISFYGRKNNGTGILRNLTDGGQGMSGYKQSEETKRKKSLAVSGEKHPSFGISPSIQTREKISAKNKGKKYSIEMRQKQSIKAKEVQNRPEVRQKNSASKLGKNNPNFGHHYYNDGKKNYMLLPDSTLIQELSLIKGRILSWDFKPKSNCFT